MRITKSRVKQIIKEEVDHSRRMKVVKEELDRTTEGLFDKLKTGVGKLMKPASAADKFPRHENIVHLWTDIGNEIKAVNESFFGKIAENYNEVLATFSDSNIPNSSVLDKIERVGEMVNYLIRTTHAGDESYSGEADWNLINRWKLFEEVSQWVKELERPEAENF